MNSFFFKDTSTQRYKIHKEGVPLRHSGLRIQRGCWCGAGSIPALETSTCHRHGQKKKKKKRYAKKTDSILTQWMIKCSPQTQVFLVRTCSHCKEVRMKSNTREVCFMIRRRQKVGAALREKNSCSFNLMQFLFCVGRGR